RFIRRLTDPAVELRVLGVRAVGKVETGYVHAGRDQVPYAGQAGYGRTQRANDLGSPPFLLAHHQCRLGRRVGVSGRAAGRDRVAPEEVVLRSPASASVSYVAAARSIHSAIASYEPSSRAS